MAADLISTANLSIQTQVSAAANGKAANGNSYLSSSSSDGRYVVFTSQATDLTASPANRFASVFWKDTQTGGVHQINGASGNTVSSPDVSDDGRYVVYDENIPTGVVIFRYDVLTQTRIQVDTSAEGVNANSNSFDPRISADGRYVTFFSIASNLVPADTNQASDLFRKDLATGTVLRVSTDAGANQTSGASGLNQYDISSDGRFVAFTSEASDLVPDDTNGRRDTFWKDLETGDIQRVNVGPNGELETRLSSSTTSLSGDGRYVAYHLNSPDSPYMTFNLYVKDMITGIVDSVTGLAGTEANYGLILDSKISDNGRFVVFSSDSPFHVPGDTNNRVDLFVYDRNTQKTSRLTPSDTGLGVDQFPQSPQIDNLGRVLFNTPSTDFSAADRSSFYDIYRISPIYAAPQISITTDSLSPSAAGVISFHVVFDQPINRITTADLALELTGSLSAELGVITKLSTSEYVVQVGTPRGEGTVRLEVVGSNLIENEWGYLAAAAASDPVSIDRVPPAQVTNVEIVQSDGSIATNPALTENTVSLRGKAESTVVVEVSIDGVLLGSTVSSSVGEWIFNANAFPLANGSHRVQVTVVDAVGNRSEPWSQTFSIDAHYLLLAPNTIAENLPSSTVVGELSTTQHNATTFSLVEGLGSGDNSRFAINGKQVTALQSFDFEGRSTYSLRVRAANADGWFAEESIAVQVTDANEAPSAISLSNRTVRENLAVGTVVGSMQTTDADANETFTYQLVAGEGDSGNAFFRLDGDRLVTDATFNFEAKNSYSIRVCSTDSRGLQLEQVFTPNITDGNDAPVLDPTKILTQYPILEDSPFTYGTAIYEFLGGVPDEDHNALRGIAIVGADGGHGRWQYTLDNFNYTSIGNVSESAALLLPAGGNVIRVRFLPDRDFVGTVSIRYVGWDQTQGEVGGVFDLSKPESRGGETAFSITSRLSPLTVTPRNDAPTLDSSKHPTFAPINEDNRNSYGTPVWSLLGGVHDVDAGAVRGMGISAVTGTSHGAWQFTLDGGLNWRSLAMAPDTVTLLPANGNLSRIRFVPNQDFFGTVHVAFLAWDQTWGVAGGGFTGIISKASFRGGIQPLSINFDTANLTINPVNDAPVLAVTDAPVGYKLNSPAVLLAATGTMRDVDSTTFAGGWFKVQITSGADSTDLLTIGGAFKIVDGNLMWNNTVAIGTVKIGGGTGSNPLLVNFNANATQYRVEQLLRSIKFSTAAGSTKTGGRTISFTMNDGNIAGNTAKVALQVS